MHLKQWRREPIVLGPSARLVSLLGRGGEHTEPGILTSGTALSQP
jgi:hypothetical protein